MSSPRAVRSEPDSTGELRAVEASLRESSDQAKAVGALPSQIGALASEVGALAREAVEQPDEAAPTVEQPRVSWTDLPRAPTMTALDEPSAHGTAFQRPLSSASQSAAIHVSGDVVVAGSDSGAIELEPDPLIGTLVADRYRVVKLLGTGGMGRVYLAEHEALRKPVALKVVHPELARDGDLAARFAREALVAGALDHPHVAGALDTGKLPDGGSYIVMQYARGVLVRDALDAAGCLSWRRACLIAAQIADALDAAHAQRIIHRDLKPENLMLESRGEGVDHVRILDFGIARQSTDSIRPPSPGMGTLTRLGTGVGTPGYMPPEQFVGERIDHRADLYALGVILYELVAGQLPYQDTDLTRVLAKQLAGRATTLSDAAADSTIPAELDTLVTSLIAPSKEDRPASAGNVRDTLRRLVGASLPADPSGPIALAEPSVRERAPSRPSLGKLELTSSDLKRAWPVAPVVGLGCFAVLVAGLAVGLAAIFGSDETDVAANAVKPVPMAQVAPAPTVVMPRTLPTDEPQPRSKARSRDRERDRDRDRDERDDRNVANPTAPRAPPIVVPSLERPTTSAPATVPTPTPTSPEPTPTPSTPRAPIAPELAADFALLQDSPRESERDEAARRLLALGPTALPPVVRASAELALATGCTEKKRWLRELATLGDARVLPQLRRITRLPRRGCGFLSLGDCHDCYRGSAARAVRVLGDS